MTRDDDTRARKLAMNQSVFRTANERFRQRADSYQFRPADRVPFICERADENCREIVNIDFPASPRRRESSTRPSDRPPR